MSAVVCVGPVDHPARRVRSSDLPQSRSRSLLTAEERGNWPPKGLAGDGGVRFLGTGSALLCGYCKEGMWWHASFFRTV